MVLRQGQHVIHPEFSARVIAPQAEPVAVLALQRAGNDDGAAGPGDVVRIDRPVSGRDVGEDAVGALRIAHVPAPLRIKSGDVEEVGLSLAFLGAVAKPALAFVALRAVGGDAPVITARAPDDIGVDAVDQFIRANKLSSARQVVVHHAAFEGDCRKAGRVVGGHARDFHKTKTVRDEAGLPGFLAAAFERVTVRDLRTAQVGHVERAVRLQGLGMPQYHAVARFAGNMEPAPADHVLAEVIDENPRLEFPDRNRLECAGDAEGRLHLGGELAARGGDDLGGRPLGIIKARIAPVWEFFSRIVFFAVKLVVGKQGAVHRELPGAITDNILAGAVGVFDPQIQEQFGKAEAHRASVSFAATGIESSVAQDHAQCIFTALEILGDVMGDIKLALVVLGQGGGQHGVADFVSVHIQLGQAESAERNRGAGNLFIHGEFFSEIACGLAAAFRRTGIGPWRHFRRAENFRRPPLGIIKAGGIPAQFRLLGDLPGFVRRDDQRLAGRELHRQLADDAGGVLSGSLMPAGESKDIGAAGFEPRGDVVPFDGLEIIPRAQVVPINPAAAFVVAGVFKNGAPDLAAGGNRHHPPEIIGLHAGLLRPDPRGAGEKLRGLHAILPDPIPLPVAGGQKSHGPLGGRAPVARFPAAVPHPDLPETRGPCRQGPAPIRNEH